MHVLRTETSTHSVCSYIQQMFIRWFPGGDRTWAGPTNDFQKLGQSGVQWGRDNKEPRGTHAGEVT